jgi:signal transduction histidine kinase
MDAKPVFPVVNGTLHELPDATLAVLAPAARLAALGELTTGVIHAVNNSLFAILANVELLLDVAPADGETAERLRLVQSSGLELRDTLRRLADATRTETGPEPALLDDEVRGTVELLLRTSRVEDVLAHYPAEPLPVVGDALQVRQAVLHLLLYAASGAGRRGTLTVEVVRDGGSAVLRIRVDGTPELPRDNGLGLVVVRTFARGLGGVLESEAPSTLRLALPAG